VAHGGEIVWHGFCVGNRGPLVVEAWVGLLGVDVGKVVRAISEGGDSGFFMGGAGGANGSK